MTVDKPQNTETVQGACPASGEGQLSRSVRKALWWPGSVTGESACLVFAHQPLTGVRLEGLEPEAYWKKISRVITIY